MQVDMNTLKLTVLHDMHAEKITSMNMFWLFAKVMLLKMRSIPFYCVVNSITGISKRGLFFGRVNSRSVPFAATAYFNSE